MAGKGSEAMGKVRFEGRLRHRFWGTYSAAIVLGFDSPAHASDALRVLGAPWEQSVTHPRCLHWAGESEALAEVKKRLAGYGADESAIDSIAHSIDYGDRFEGEIPVTPAEQGALFP